MEDQYTNGEIESGAGETTAAAEVAEKRHMRRYDVALRLTSLTFNLGAAVLLGLDKQTETVTARVDPTRLPVSFMATAKWSYLPSFVYLVVVNGVSSVYASILITLTLANKNGKIIRTNGVWIILLDLIMIGFLFSGIGAVAAIGHLGYKGDAHIHWNRVCKSFDSFCHRAISSIVLSFISALGYFLCVLLAAINLHRNAS